MNSCNIVSNNGIANIVVIVDGVKYTGTKKEKAQNKDTSDP